MPREPKVSRASLITVPEHAVPAVYTRPWGLLIPVAEREVNPFVVIPCSSNTSMPAFKVYLTDIFFSLS